MRTRSRAPSAFNVLPSGAAGAVIGADGSVLPLKADPLAQATEPDLVPETRAKRRLER